MRPAISLIGFLRSDGFAGNREDSAVEQGFRQLRERSQMKIGKEHLAWTKQGALRQQGFLHFDDTLCLLKDLRLRLCDGRTHLLILSISISTAGTGRLFHQHLVPCLT
jgi:hypothetical protein